MTRAASMWKSVPIVVVITKSYSVPEREKNEELVRAAFAAQKQLEGRVRRIIPVVAAPFILNENAFAAPEGIPELIDCTNSLMPEGMQAAEQDLASFLLNRKRVLAQAVVTTATAAAVTVGAVPVPYADAALLTPVELAEVNAIARIFGIGKEERSKHFLNAIVEVGTVGAAAKGLIGALKAVPGLNLGAGVINAVIAGVIVAALGEASVYAFEQIYLGNKTVADIDWVKKIIESRMSLTLITKAKPFLGKLTSASDAKAVLAAVLELSASLFGGKK